MIEIGSNLTFLLQFVVIVLVVLAILRLFASKL